MRAGGLTERYVKALSGMELPKGLTLKTLHQQISAFAQVYEQGDELREILENPFFGDAERKGVIDVLAKKLKVSPICKNFISLLVDKKRTRLLPGITSDLSRLLDEQSGVALAKVTSATALTKAQLKGLGKVLTDLKGTPVRIESFVDPTLMGGLVIEMAGTLYDGTVKRRIDSIRDSIVKEAR